MFALFKLFMHVKLRDYSSFPFGCIYFCDRVYIVGILSLIRIRNSKNLCFQRARERDIYIDNFTSSRFSKTFLKGIQYFVTNDALSEYSDLSLDSFYTFIEINHER